MIGGLVGDSSGTRLWAYEVDAEFSTIQIGDLLRISRGPFHGEYVRVQGKLLNSYDRFIFGTINKGHTNEYSTR